MDRIGDNNKAIKSKADHIAFILSQHELGGNPYMIAHITRAGREKKKTSNSTKHQIGRMQLLNAILKQGGLSPGDQKSSAEYAIMGYKNSNKEIRNLSYTALMTLYWQMGPGLKSYMSDMWKNQIETLQEGFDEIDGVDPESKSQAPASEPTITTNINPSGAKG